MNGVFWQVAKALWGKPDEWTVSGARATHGSGWILADDPYDRTYVQFRNSERLYLGPFQSLFLILLAIRVSTKFEKKERKTVESRILLALKMRGSNDPRARYARNRLVLRVRPILVPLLRWAENP